MKAFDLSWDPFPATHALNVETLNISASLGYKSSGFISSEPPSSSRKANPLDHIPGEPCVGLETEVVNEYLVRELHTPLLDELYPRLWLVAKQSGKHIDALHLQKIKGRGIVISEDPRLHLVWHAHSIFIKPLPICLLNYQFWTTYLSAESSTTNMFGQNRQEDSHAVALGFMRSYAFLIQHRSDFAIAQETRLVPDNIEWTRWSRFIGSFRHVDDVYVAKRYHYGQLRVSRLNWAVRIFGPKSADTRWYYERPFWSTTPYIGHFAAPLLFSFASLSLILSSMQVMLAVPMDGLGFLSAGSPQHVHYLRACWVFSIVVLLMSGMCWVLLAVIPSMVIGAQVWWGYSKRNNGAISSS